MRYFLSSLALLTLTLLVILLLFGTAAGHEWVVSRGAAVVWEEGRGSVLPEIEYPLWLFRPAEVRTREVKKGDPVKKGDLLMTLFLPEGSDEVAVYAHRDGLVSFINEEERLEKNAPLVRLTAAISALAEISLPPESRAGVGDLVQVEYENQKIAGEVIGWEESAGEKRARIRLKTSLPTLADFQAKIITDFKDNVLVVPTAALKSKGGRVFVRQKSLFWHKEQKVEIGLRGNEYSEILAGLKEGDKILTENN